MSNANYSSISNSERGQLSYSASANQSQGHIAPYNAPAKSSTSKWIKIGIPVAVVVIVAAVLGGVLGSRHKNNNNSSSSQAGTPAGEAAASAAASQKLQIGVFPTSTNSEFMVPVYPSTTNTAAFTNPTFHPSNNADFAWPADPFKPGSPSTTNVRTDRPRLIAPAYKWAALPKLIQNDPYLKSWNNTIFGNASDFLSQDPVKYFMDNSSGILDNARDVKRRIKTFAYAYRMSNDTKWSERAWTELQNAAGNGTQPFGPDTDRWNSAHFLDTAEFTAAFGIAYDWLFDAWTPDQRSQIISTMIKYGLQPGMDAINGGVNGWWRNNINGNWNCVSNSGLTMGALAILGDDPSGLAKQILQNTVDNMKANCAQGPSDDGTWAETANYWYFGTTGHAEMTASLMTATGSDFGLLDANANFFKTGLFHMYVYGQTSLFNYGDHGPNKYSTTANSMILYASAYNQPQFALFQRDRPDAAEPWSMFWYDPTVAGAFWDGLPLDQSFDNTNDQWASMRGSWTDMSSVYAAIKAGQNSNHQTHNDLDAGDFVIDALGTRWAGELGSADYNAPGYFNSGAQDSDRWKYYRKMTEGQNTLVVDKANQNAANKPGTVKFESTGEKQGSSTVFEIPSDSTAYFVADITDAYFKATSVKRGLRLLNARKQILIQDEINAQADVQWRMHTNATVTVNNDNTISLALDNQNLKMVVLNPPSGMAITTTKAVRYDSDPTPPIPDQDNPGVTVIVISIPSGQSTLEVLFNPQWPGMQDSGFVTPKSVPLDNWSLTSHN